MALTVAATAQPDRPSQAIKLTKGIIKDVRTGKPVDGGRVMVYLGSGSEPVALSKINPSTGAYQVVLGPSKEYRFVLRSDRFLPTETTVRTPDGAGYEEYVKDLTMEPIPVGSTLFSGRLFDAGGAELRTNGELAKALAFMKQSQAATLKITVIPDLASKSSKAKAKPAAKAKKGKKKGNATTTSVEEPPATSSPTGTGSQDPLAALAQARVQALRALMQREGISLTRITWVALATPSELRLYAGRKENVVIAINGIDVEEVEED